jgi:hypothetical protein
MMRRPTIRLTPDEHAAVGRWTRRILGAWVAVVAATLSLSLLGSDRSGRAQVPMAECSGMVCLQQAVESKSARR